MYLQFLLMTKRIKTLTVLVFAFLALLCTSNRCGSNQIWRKTQCVACQSLQHTIHKVDEKISAGDMCLCQKGYEWNYGKLQCSNITYIQGNYQKNEELEHSSRLLALTCDTSKGFVYFTSTYITTGNPEACINCRNILYGSGAAVNSTDCSCQQNFRMRWSSKTCYCNGVYDPPTQKCLACQTLGTDSTTYTGCDKCNLPYLQWGYHGCINCKKLANNGGDTSCCNSDAGYTFNGILGRCICQSGWGIDSSGKCASCGTNTDCSGKKKTYVNDNYEVKYYTFVPNYDPNTGTSGGCKSGFAYKKNLVTNQILGCACSKAALNFLSGNKCILCSTPPISVTKANCEACSTASGFWPGPYECVYCKGDSNSLGTASESGCDCKANYYWNLNTAKCECDFALGFIGTASACIDCSKIANTGIDMVEGACSCNSGYKWNSNTNACDCDTTSPAVFSSNSQCVSCTIMNIPGSTGKIGTDGKSCECSKGYYWNPGKADCVCDSSQNYFVDTDGYCKECHNVPMSIGLGFSQSCICKKGLQWDLIGKKCVCPTGFVQMKQKCASCSSLTFANGATTSDCTSCSNAKGFAKYNGDCYFCGDQFMVNAAVTGGVCTCKAASMTWYPERSGCACNMNQDLMLVYDSGAGTYSCEGCNWIYTSNGKCSCPSRYQTYDSLTNTCTDCRDLPNSVYNSTNRVCKCNSGYSWSFETFPMTCIKTNFVKVGTGFYSPIGSASTLCSTLSGTALDACSSCTTAGGYVWIVNNDVCLKCSGVTDATGVAVENGCLCISGKYFDAIKMACVASTCAAGFTYNPNSGACDLCDPVKSVMVGGLCVSCVADSKSLGFAKTSSECACKSGSTWKDGACGDGSCDTGKSIWIGTICFACPSTNKGTGLPTNGNTKCGCTNNYSWVATLTGGSCQCPSDIAYVAPDTNCFFCPTDTNTVGTALAAGNGCNCKNSYAWSATSKLCICDSTVSGFKKSNGNCFICSSTVDPNFDGTVITGTKSTCGCKNGYQFTAIPTGTGEGSCTCPSATSILGSGGKCVKCSSDPKSDAGKLDGTTKCACANGWVWSTIGNKCICDSTVSGIPLSSGACFICSSTADPNFTGSDGTKCTCDNSFSFVASPSGGSCQCQSPKVISNGECTGCTVTAFSDGTTDNKGGCTCLKNYVWSAESSACECNQLVNGFIDNGNCFVCAASDANPLFNGLDQTGTECLCLNGFTFSTVDNTCKCSSPETLLQATNQCVTCPTEAQGGTGNANAAGDGCQCANGKLWTSTQGCSCLATQVVLASGGCLTCGTAGTFTKGKSGNECTCSNAGDVWNAEAGLCDCGEGKAMVVTGSKRVCVTCDAAVNAEGKADFKSCSCLTTSLTWNEVSKACVCESSQYFANGDCNQCTADKYAKTQNNPKKSSECTCLVSALVWSATDELCRCKKATDVIFMANNVPTCKACGPGINSNAVVVSETECQCAQGFVWADNIGCMCENPDAILLTKPTRCVVCDQTTYSSGPAADRRTCACLGTLKWNKNTDSCGCLKKTQALLTSNDQYSCFQCKNAAANTAAPVINGNQCTCSPINPDLSWYDIGLCGCSDITSMVWVGKPLNKCVTCDDSINSNGKASVSAKTCTCVDPALSFVNGICDCGKDSALITQGQDNVKCVNCKDATRNLKSKKSSTECACISTGLIWDNVDGLCRCQDTTKVMVGSSSKITCKSCVGDYILASDPVDQRNCGCIFEDHVFTVSSKGVLSCWCPVANSITNYETRCLTCTDTKKTLTPYQCTCPKNSFWDTINKKCVACTDIAGAVGNNGLTCKCSDNTKIWDVVKRQCIDPCTGQDCLDCTQIAFATGETAVAVDPAVGGFVGGAAVQKLLNVASTNYAQLSKYQCPCNEGFIWDKYRLSCLSQLLIAIP